MNERRQRILLVEDDPHLVLTLRDFLAFEGYDVATAADGEQGLAQARTCPPDLIILDISMPGMGGLGFLNQIKGADGRPRYPVLVFTARSAMKDFFDTLPIDGFVEKPCERAELLTRIRAILDRSPQSSDRARASDAPRSILLGEDDPVISAPIRSALEEAGYAVTVIASGPELLERAASSRPDGIVVKQIFTRMNGSAVAVLLNQMAATRSIPVILYDAGGMLPDGEARRAVA